jgi:hypothetical protein
MSGKFWSDEQEREERRPAALHAVDGDAALPGLDDPYKAFSGLTTNRQESLCVVLGHEAVENGEELYRTFEYHHKASDTGLAFAKDGTHVMRLRFVGPDSVTIMITGTNLLRAYHLINRHRIGWIRLFDPVRNFPRLESDGGKKAEVITGIEIIYDEKRRKAGPIPAASPSA